MKVNNLDSMIYLNYWILQTLLAYIGKELIQINHPNNDLAAGEIFPRFGGEAEINPAFGG